MSQIPTKYNAENIYKKQIEPLVKQIENICLANRIPVFFSVAVSGSEKKTVYKHSGISPETLGLVLHDNMFSKHLAVICGCGVYPPGVDPFADEEVEQTGNSTRLTDRLNEDTD